MRHMSTSESAIPNPLHEEPYKVKLASGYWERMKRSRSPRMVFLQLQQADWWFQYWCPSKFFKIHKKINYKNQLKNPKNPVKSLKMSSKSIENHQKSRCLKIVTWHYQVVVELLERLLVGQFLRIQRRLRRIEFGERRSVSSRLACIVDIASILLQSVR